jgi:hypothetical protein
MQQPLQEIFIADPYTSIALVVAATNDRNQAGLDVSAGTLLFGGTKSGSPSTKNRFALISPVRIMSRRCDSVQLALSQCAIYEVSGIID